jgi:hypothetical protein
MCLKNDHSKTGQSGFRVVIMTFLFTVWQSNGENERAADHAISSQASAARGLNGHFFST